MINSDKRDKRGWPLTVEKKPERKHGSIRVTCDAPSLRDVAHDGVLCTFSNKSASDRDKWCGLSGQAAWTVHHVQNHTLLGHFPSASQAGRRVGPALSPSASLVETEANRDSWSTYERGPSLVGRQVQ